MKENRIQLRTIRQRPGLSNFVLPFIDALLESGRTELSGPSVTKDPVACIVSQARTVMDADDWLLAWDLLQAEQEGAASLRLDFICFFVRSVIKYA